MVKQNVVRYVEKICFSNLTPSLVEKLVFREYSMQYIILLNGDNAQNSMYSTETANSHKDRCF